MKTKKSAKFWRCWAPGGESLLGFFFLVSLFLSVNLHAQTKVDGDLGYNPFVKPPTHKMDATPFVPSTRDYGVELGTMWQHQTFFWLGGHLGFHTGHCLFSNSESCQQYLDVIFGGGGQENDEIFTLLTGPRWQFVNYPASWSQFVRLMGGYMYLEIADRKRDRPAVAVSYGITRYLHQRMDFRVEARAGVAEKPFSQVTIGFQFKIDSWVEYFANKFQGLGEGTLKATGSLIEATGKVLSTPFRSEEKTEPEAESKK